MSKNKETNFFAFENEDLDCSGPGADYINNSVTTLSDYQQMYEGRIRETAVGEASPLYLYSKKAPGQILHHVPEARLIAILRSPVEQAYSHYLYARRQMLEPLDDFVAALQAEQERNEKSWQPLFQYSEFPKYGEQLSRYFDLFPREQLKILTYEEFRDDPLDVMSEIFSFIGTDKNFIPDVSYRPNAGGIPSNRFLQSAVVKPHLATRLAGYLLPEEVKRRIRDMVSDRNLEKPDIPGDAKAILLSRLQGDIIRLQELLDRDLAAWLQ